MKKQKKTKLSLDKFKVPKISNFEKGNVFGGETNANDQGTDDETTTGTKDQRPENRSRFNKDFLGNCLNK